jgi:Tfp pilus assembly protein PilO
MTLTVRDRILLAVIVGVLVVVGFTHFALSPQRHRAAILETQVTAAQAALANARDRYATGHAATASLHGNAPAWAAAQRAVPQVSDIPGLLRLLERNAQKAHVSMQSITLAGAPASAGAVGPTSSEGATEVPISLSFDGGYQALNRLLAQLDDLVVVSGDSLRASGPLVGISNVSLATGGTGASGGTGLSVSLTAVIYQHSASNTVLGPDTEATP